MSLQDHIKHPRNVGRLKDANGYAKAGGGQCADIVEMWIRVDEDVIVDIAFQCDGCETTLACGSAATELARGRQLDEAADIAAETISQALGGLPAEYRHCAATAAEALSNAIWGYTVGAVRRKVE